MLIQPSLRGTFQHLDSAGVGFPVGQTERIKSLGEGLSFSFWHLMLRTIFLNSLVLAALGEDGVSMFAVACAVLNFATAFVAGAGQAVSPLMESVIIPVSVC